jgi:hypothetical protein
MAKSLASIMPTRGDKPGVVIVPKDIDMVSIEWSRVNGRKPG